MPLPKNTLRQNSENLHLSCQGNTFLTDGRDELWEALKKQANPVSKEEILRRITELKKGK